MAVKKGFLLDFSHGHPKQFGLWRADFSLELTEEVSVASGSSRVVIDYLFLPCKMEYRTLHCSWKSAELALDFTANSPPNRGVLQPTAKGYLYFISHYKGRWKIDSSALQFCSN